jgi:hypothetical protein
VPRHSTHSVKVPRHQNKQARAQRARYCRPNNTVVLIAALTFKRHSQATGNSHTFCAQCSFQFQSIQGACHRLAQCQRRCQSATNKNASPQQCTQSYSIARRCVPPQSTPTALIAFRRPSQSKARDFTTHVVMSPPSIDTLEHFKYFLHAYVSTVLYLRSIYRPKIFAEVRFHNTTVFQSRSLKLRD